MRELVVALIAILVAYLLWVVLRWWRLTRKPSNAQPPLQFREPVITPAEEEPSSRAATTRLIDVHAGDDEDDEDADGDEKTSLPRGKDNDIPSSLYGKPRPPGEPDASAFGFDALLEVRQGRHLVDGLAQEIATLKQEMQLLKQELADLRAASRVSPQYGEAVGLARRGLDANAIAERCGISVAEAELVRSLLAMSPSGE